MGGTDQRSDVLLSLLSNATVGPADESLTPCYSALPAKVRHFTREREQSLHWSLLSSICRRASMQVGRKKNAYPSRRRNSCRRNHQRRLPISCLTTGRSSHLTAPQTGPNSGLGQLGRSSSARASIWNVVFFGLRIVAQQLRRDGGQTAVGGRVISVPAAAHPQASIHQRRCIRRGHITDMMLLL